MKTSTRTHYGRVALVTGAAAKASAERSHWH
jgi:hypothetical protein